MSNYDRFGWIGLWLLVAFCAAVFAWGCYENVQLKKELREWKALREKK